ncbi:hypothetical protein [Microbacterium tumbae]
MAQENVSETSSDAAFAVALREAITARGVTLAWLNARLRSNGNPVSMATLSYWRAGARRPEGAQSMAAVEDMERLLDLAPGALTGLVGRSLRVGPFGTPSFPLRERDLEQAVTEVFTALGEPNPDRARDVTTHAVTLVGPDGNVISRTTRTLLQSMSGLITHVPYVEITPGVRTPPPVFVALGGGRVTQLYSHDSGQVHGFSFELEQPIDTAQTTVLEWRMEVTPDYPPTKETGHGIARQCRELLLWTQFHPDAVPDWMDEMIDTPERTTSTPLALDAGTSVHQVRRRFGPGLLALRWGYGERE